MKQDRSRFWIEVVIAILFLGFFLYCAAPALGAHFAADEMMNMYGYWAPGAWKAALANISFWSATYRPMGAVYYLPIFTAFGFDPLPFNAVRLAILLLSAAVFFYLAVLISASRLVAAVAALPVAYHASIPNLAYEGAMIYDVLCGLFFFSALAYYVRLRQKNKGGLSLPQICVFLALYICALNSKEMAVSAPVLLLAYELIFHRRDFIVRPLFASIAITIVFIAGKTLGPHALTAVESYRPVFTLARFFESSERFLNAIFYTGGFTAGGVILTWSILLAVAIFARDRRLLFLWIWVTVTPLPVAFLPGRTGGALYIVASGWALAAAILLQTLASKVPLRAAAPSILAAAALLYAVETGRRQPMVEHTYLDGIDDTERLIEQFRALPVRPVPGSEIAFLNDPFPTSFDTQFVAALWWRDRSLTIRLQHEACLSRTELSRMNYIFDFAGGALRRVK